mgnify:CR=1 FL=1
MIPADNLEKLISLGAHLSETWKDNEHFGTFQTMKEEIKWQKDKKRLKELMRRVIEEIHEEEIDDVTGYGV